VKHYDHGPESAKPCASMGGVRVSTAVAFPFSGGSYRARSYLSTSSFKVTLKAVAMRSKARSPGSDLAVSMAEMCSRVSSAWSARICWVHPRFSLNRRMRPPTQTQMSVAISQG